MPRFTVMTFNVRYAEADDGRHAWPHRRNLALGTVREHDPDLLGLQEPTTGQFEEIAAVLPGRAAFGAVINAEGGARHDHSGFIRTSRFAIRDTGLFWLSDTPHEPESESWGNDWGPRACGWV